VTVVSIETTAAEFISTENILNNWLNRLNWFVYRLDWLKNWDWFFDDLDWLWDWNSYDWDIFARTEPASCLTESRNGGIAASVTPLTTASEFVGTVNVEYWLDWLDR
jgi:hypothetical protein